MSAIGDRLETLDTEETTLNAFVFGTYAMAFMLGDATAGQARDRLNAHITENGGAVLTTQEETDIQNMRTHYLSLTADQQHEYRDRLMAYGQQLQDLRITVAQWDTLMGL